MQASRHSLPSLYSLNVGCHLRLLPLAVLDPLLDDGRRVDSVLAEPDNVRGRLEQLV